MIANSFNDHFANATTEIVKEIPRSKNDFINYLPEYSAENFKFKRITYDKIEEIINNLESKSSQDIDGNSSLVVKKVSSQISTILAHLVNLSFDNCSFPDELKTSKICPIFKSGDRNSMDNYRPISCLPIWSKIYERIVFDQLSFHLSVNKILSPNQFGFRKGLSTSHALLDVVNFISKNWNDGKIVAGVFLDLKKSV